MYQPTEAIGQPSERELLCEQAEQYFDEYELRLAEGNSFLATIALNNANHLIRRAYALHKPIAPSASQYWPNDRA